jgi:hypothetical protein
MLPAIVSTNGDGFAVALRISAPIRRVQVTASARAKNLNRANGEVLEAVMMIQVSHQFQSKMTGVAQI